MMELQMIDEILYKMYQEYILSIEQLREICDLTCICRKWQRMNELCQYSNRYMLILNEYFKNIDSTSETLYFNDVDF
ncbi:hypothetical protein LCDVSa174L [Lymphocystis disease virus 3]|uniref:Uncharacterized protein n=1 Tax=Lymphocystis disease virus 3 TaxID=2560566 RepID=A0A1B2RW87_9VIRU|nr:hypothetical protein BZK12_gp174 [Lymphocystis disease virus Sa]AOC55258.1 hypothetical protein LCDVSa174L [Lymphocystis disease virus 3]